MTTDATHPVYPQLDWGNQGAKMEGLSKREYFAAIALNAVMSFSHQKDGNPHTFETLSQSAVKAADALITQLNKVNG